MLSPLVGSEQAASLPIQRQARPAPRALPRCSRAPDRRRRATRRALAQRLQRCNHARKRCLGQWPEQPAPCCNRGNAKSAGRGWHRGTSRIPTLLAATPAAWRLPSWFALPSVCGCSVELSRAQGPTAHARWIPRLRLRRLSTLDGRSCRLVLVLMPESPGQLFCGYESGVRSVLPSPIPR